MSYNNFLALINENTNNQCEDYKWLCRFCLQKRSHGIDLISENKNNYETAQQREALFENYYIITKKYLPTSSECPNFVCSSCESNLSQNATFIRQIEENAENWDIFLKRDNDVNVQMDYDPMTIIEIDEIKIEKCEDDVFVNVPETNVSDAFDPSMSNDEKPIAMVHIHTESPALCYQEALNDNAIHVSSRKRRRVHKSEPKHMTRTTEYERTCKLCNEPTFSSMGLYYQHQRRQHPGEKSFTCDICSTKFTEKYQVYTHMKDRHSKSGKKHQCQFCAKLFFSDREVKGHEKSHLNTRSYKCTLCGKGFNGKTNLNSHLKSKIHSAELKTTYKKKIYATKQVYRCEYCRPHMVFTSAEERANHKNSVHRTYECDICKNSFMAQESLDSHKLRHSNKPRKYECSVCNATFNQSSHLTSHYKHKHTSEKTFHCSHCDKSFFESCGLGAHVKLVHRKQERVKCLECPSSFAANKYLQKHILQKHSTEASRYDCNVCGKRCADGAKLDLHRIKNHQ